MYVMVRYRETAEVLTTALANRIADFLPKDKFTVSANGLALSVQSIGPERRGIVCTPALGLIKGKSNSEKLKTACELAAESVGPFLAPNEEAHVNVTEHAVAIWWGGPLEHEATLRLGAIKREELRI
jgi:hypothetical protein